MPVDLPPSMYALIENAHQALAWADYYELLGVEKTASHREIRHAFDTLCTVLHPDRYHGMVDEHARDRLRRVYMRVQEAYRVLADPALRDAYHQALGRGDKRLDASTITRERDAAIARRSPP